jgi:hypothetical protein
MENSKLARDNDPYIGWARSLQDGPFPKYSSAAIHKLEDDVVIIREWSQERIQRQNEIQRQKLRGDNLFIPEGRKSLVFITSSSVCSSALAFAVSNRNGHSLEVHQ